MNEHARVDVAVGIDVQITPAPGNAAADIFSIVLKVDGKNWFRLAEMADLLDHPGPLIGGWH